MKEFRSPSQKTQIRVASPIKSALDHATEWEHREGVTAKPHLLKKSLQETRRPRQKTQVRLRTASVMGHDQQARFTAAARALLADIVRHVEQPKDASATNDKGNSDEGNRKRE